MNRAKIIVIKVIFSALLTVVATLCFIDSHYSIVAIIVILIVALIFSISSDHRKSTRLMEQMIMNIRCGDLNISFPSNLKKSGRDLNKAMNEALEMFRSQLSESIVSKAETEAWQKLIRVLTHEMMNSIAPIISLSETITEQANEDLTEERYDEIMAAMQSIHRRSKGLLDFVENYRKLTRIPMPVMRYFSINELFSDMKKLFANEIIPVSFFVKSEDTMLYADRSMIEQVLINLLKNALDACRNTDAPLISVDAFTDKGKQIIAVSDNGSGIVPEALDRIFVPFFTTKHGGSGIGLSLCRQIINRHNGVISVISEPDRKTVFTIKFQ
ncbi:MAG: HAMP domain-containing histidine kinase [Prevotellaceae bacterium]|jgi:signal transduction histidine kinase|nr:HAMP domain-containing histidine kinase [Prevotellaceae bacterium]